MKDFFLHKDPLITSQVWLPNRHPMSWRLIQKLISGVIKRVLYKTQILYSNQHLRQIILKIPLFTLSETLGHFIFPRVSLRPWFEGQREDRKLVSIVWSLSQSHLSILRIVEKAMCVCLKDYETVDHLI
jgi:hypothetical protein